MVWSGFPASIESYILSRNSPQGLKFDSIYSIITFVSVDQLIVVTSVFMHYYSQIMTTAHTSCHWPAAACEHCLIF